mmetsp:Transcript_75755/g.225851  ORF Transcript_75755/g.225851 Transcript_75755/m.225851 type:complete len:210 (+) Transcript_75755:327-956(+)
MAPGPCLEGHEAVQGGAGAIAEGHGRPLHRLRAEVAPDVHDRPALASLEVLVDLRRADQGLETEQRPRVWPLVRRLGHQAHLALSASRGVVDVNGSGRVLNGEPLLAPLARSGDGVVGAHGVVEGDDPGGPGDLLDKLAARRVILQTDGPLIVEVDDVGLVLDEGEAVLVEAPASAPAVRDGHRLLGTLTVHENTVLRAHAHVLQTAFH